jgi:hypothetical protein
VGDGLSPFSCIRESLALWARLKTQCYILAGLELNARLDRPQWTRSASGSARSRAMIWRGRAKRRSRPASHRPAACEGSCCGGHAASGIGDSGENNRQTVCPTVTLPSASRTGSGIPPELCLVLRPLQATRSESAIVKTRPDVGAPVHGWNVSAWRTVRRCRQH